MVENQHTRAVGLFQDHEAVEQALSELKASDFPMDKVSVIAKRAEPDEQVGEVETSDRIGNQNVNSAKGVVGDAITNATWGTILVGLTSLAIPGAGPVLAAGSLGVALVTGVAGTGLSAVNINGLTNALKDLGIPQEQASVYSDRLLQGDYLTIVDGSDDEVNRAEAILSDQGIQHWGVYQSA